MESDNVPSQRCFESLGELIGLYNGGMLRLPEEQARFEEANLDLIDDNMAGACGAPWRRAKKAAEPRA